MISRKDCEEKCKIHKDMISYYLYFFAKNLCGLCVKQ